MEKIEYTPLNLPKTLVEELKIWKMAFAAAYGKTISYAEMIRGMLDSLPQTEPGVLEELDRITKKHPELTVKMAIYNGDSNE